MRILLIGNFAPPFEEENLHNLTLLDLLRQDGNDCCVINISEKPAKEQGFINIKSYPDFIIKLVRCAWKRDVMHFLTKGYTRPGLMKLITAVVISRMFWARPVITLHPEMFAVFGRLRSKMGGQQLLHLSFSLAKKVICGDLHTYEIAAMHYQAKDKFVMILPAIKIPGEIKEDELLFLEPLKNKKRVIFVSDIKYPSLLFDMLNILLSKYLDQDTGIAISFSEGFSARLEIAIKEAGRKHLANMVLIDYTEKRLLSIACSNADFVLRIPNCDGKTLFEEMAFIVRRAVRSENYLYFPASFLLLKEGETTEVCADIFNAILMKTAEMPAVSLPEDFEKQLKDIYTA